MIGGRGYKTTLLYYALRCFHKGFGYDRNMPVGILLDLLNATKTFALLRRICNVCTTKITGDRPFEHGRLLHVTGKTVTSEVF